MPKVEVFKANPYEPYSMHSLGNANCMLIRQHEFPFIYNDSLDVMAGQIDHDRLNYSRAIECFRRHTGTGDGGFQSWAQNSEPPKMLSFLEDILEKHNPSVPWSGFRILGTVNRSNGGSVWHLELFAKHPKSGTKVYSEFSAPNVKTIQTRTVFNLW